jgi:L-seryl-tRNA(Ser) seleniumtransferase
MLSDKTSANCASVDAPSLPSVDRLLRRDSSRRLVAQHGHSFVVSELRRLLDELRARARSGSLAAHAIDETTLDNALIERCARRLEPRMRSVFNLSGTVVHTNLGRAVLAESALTFLLATMTGPNNLEYDLASGGRGDRDSLVEDLLTEITGAEAATVVNNNAAAVMLTLAALAQDKEVVISRGELVEIGGSFRMPDVMKSAGAHMVDVGTTNRTHPRDYERAINPRTGLLLKVHTSNYVVQGFTASVGEAELADIAHAHGLPLASDLGSGSLVDLAGYGLPHEPLPQEMLAAGCDVVTFSGDKLLGGPQAGLIVGKKEIIDRIRKFPMKRALRASKLPLAALEATLRLYLRPERLARDLPTLRLLTRPVDAIRTMAEELVAPLTRAVSPGYTVAVADMSSQIGSGSLPVERLPSAGLILAPAGSTRGTGSALDRLAEALRSLPTPVIGRVANDRLWMDLRCLEDADAFTAQLAMLREALQ